MARDIGVDEVRAKLGGAILAFHGLEAARFSRALPVSNASPGSLSFCRAGDARAEEWLRSTKASVVLVGSEFVHLSDAPTDKAILVVVDPRLEFMRILHAWLADPRPAPGIHPSAVVHAEAQIDPAAHIGPNCTIGRAEIGAGTVLHGNNHVYDRVKIGQNCTIHAGTVIGAAGFGYQRTESGEWEHFPHVGGVVVEDDVDIGANACIDRGAMIDTTIKRGAKLDNLVHIAHNVQIGEHALIISGAQVAGSSVIGDHAWVAPGAIVTDNVKIGRETTIGLGSVIVKDVPDFAKTMTQPAATLPERFWNKPRG